MSTMKFVEGACEICGENKPVTKTKGRMCCSLCVPLWGGTVRYPELVAKCLDLAGVDHAQPANNDTPTGKTLELQAALDESRKVVEDISEILGANQVDMVLPFARGRMEEIQNVLLEKEKLIVMLDDTRVERDILYKENLKIKEMLGRSGEENIRLVRQIDTLHSQIEQMGNFIPTTSDKNRDSLLLDFPNRIGTGKRRHENHCSVEVI